MAAFQLSPQADPNKVFLVNLSETEGRLDPSFYKPSYIENAEKIKAVSHKKIKEIARFSNETWNQKDFFSNVFPYIEISEINTTTGEIENINLVKVSDAPSRAKMIVRNNDIIISTTRPNRGAISKISLEEGINIASTGFSIIRDIKDVEIHRDYLFLMLRQSFSLQQMEQRSSGGNYPAITQDELGKVLIPLLSPEEQIKIIEKFQSAYTSKQTAEAEARRLLSSIDDYILAELGITLPTADNSLENRVFFANYSEVSGGRFDPLFYTQNFIEQIKKGTFPLETLKDWIEYAITGFAAGRLEQSENEEDIIQIRPTNIDNERNLKFDKNVYIDKHQLVNKENDILQVGEILFNNTNSQEMVGKTVFFDLEDTYFCSNHITRIKAKEGLNPLFLTYILNLYQRHQIFYKICTNWNNQSGVNASVLAKIKIPLPDPDKQKEIAETAQAMRQKAQELMQQGKTILEQTKREVEEMILAPSSV